MVHEFHLYLWPYSCFQNMKIIFSVRYLVWMVSVEITKYHFAFEFWGGISICMNVQQQLIFDEACLLYSVLLDSLQGLKAQVCKWPIITSVLIMLPSSKPCAPVPGQLKEE